jgi:hypothetical protein
VTSDWLDRSPPSPSALCDHPRCPRRHPGHCIAIPDAVEVCVDETPPRQLLYPRTTSRQRHPQVLTRAAAEQETSTPPPSKPFPDAHRTRHDAPLEERFTRTVVYSATLYTMPLHVGEIVWHTCKLSPPWPIKGGAIPYPQGRTDSDHMHAFRLDHDIGTCLNQYLWDLEVRPPLQPRL